MVESLSEPIEAEHSFEDLVDMLKQKGNEAFQRGDLDSVKKAIKFYSDGLDLDPDNHILYSNMKSDSISEALRDAQKCINLQPSFSKGYSRLGAAQQALRRYVDAIDTFKKGISIDSSNQSLWSSLTACQDAYELDKKHRYAQAEIERQKEEELQVWRERNLRKDKDKFTTNAAVASGIVQILIWQTSLQIYMLPPVLVMGQWYLPWYPPPPPYYLKKIWRW